MGDGCREAAKGAESEADSSEIGRLLKQARTLLDVGKLSDVEMACREVLARDRANLEAKRLLGIAFVKAGQFRPADESLRYVLSKDPESYEANYWLSQLHLLSGDRLQAVAFAERAVKSNPSLAEGYGNLGTALLAFGQPWKALSPLQTAIRLDPNSSAHRHSIGVAYYRLMQLDEAEAHLIAARSLAPLSPSSYVTLIQVYRDQRRFSAGEECLTSIQKLIGENPASLADLAVRLFREGMFAETLSVGQRLLAVDANHLQGLMLVGQSLKKLGRFPEAVETLERVVKLRPNQMNAHVDILSSRRATEEDRPRIAILETTVQNPQMPTEGAKSIHYALGKAHDDLGDYERAYRHFASANAMVYASLGASRLDMNEHRQVVSNTIELFSKEFIAGRTREPDKFPTPILVVGMIRSGTTLLEQILSNHPDIAAGGELDYLTRKSKAFVDYLAPSVDLSRSYDYVQGYEALLRARANGKLFITDKMPTNFLVLGLISRLFPAAKIIHCRRDPLDTCLSIFTTQFEEPVNFAHSPGQIVAWYREYQRLMEHWRSVLSPEQFLEVDYEEIVRDREPVIRRVLEHCEASWHPDCMDHHQNSQAIRTPSWWQARQPVYRSSVGRWKHYEPWLSEFKELTDLSVTGQVGGGVGRGSVW